MPTITAPVRNGGYPRFKDVTSDEGVAWKPTIFVQAPLLKEISLKNTRFQNQRWWNKVPARKRTGCL
jgi:hypothetical protein